MKSGDAKLLHRVEQGVAPAHAERIQTSGEGEETAITHDEHGIALKGIRMPSVDVLVSTPTGAAPAGGPSHCSLFGASYPFENATLASLYGTRANYLALFTSSLDEAS